MIKQGYKFSAFALLGCLLLAGCVTREQADAKLARACAAGVEAFLPEGTRVREIKNSTFGENNELGSGLREVRLTVLEGDDWLEVDKEYKCIFAENMGPFGLSHSAEIYQVKFDGQVYGKEGDLIIGSMDDFVKLGNAVDSALGK